MRNLLVGGILGITLALSSALPARAADDEKEPLVNQVRDAIQRGIQFLRDQEQGNGHWEVDGTVSLGRAGGWSALSMLALLNAGIKPSDPIIERGLQYLRNIKPEHTYVVGLQTMVYAAAGHKEDLTRIQENVDWLIEAGRGLKNDAENFHGWSYGMGIGFGTDNSNTQYALLGLHEGHRAGAKISDKVWKKIRDYYISHQNLDGGWGYAPLQGNGSILTMTTAGLCGLLIAGMELNPAREVLQPDGSARGCGRYDENPSVNAALEWIGGHFRVDMSAHKYYNLYGLERAGRLTGQRFLGSHDWYREGCEFLVRNQNKAEGYWAGGTSTDDHWKVVSTSFALLFLSKGRTPILISKLVHGPGEDWNNDRNDARNLVEYASKNLFSNQPMAWQIFDAKRGVAENTREELLRLVGDLLQSPIAYFNGHKAPHFTKMEEDLLKEYVEQGGFIFAEACCRRPEFDQGFRELMKRLFPDTPLRPLPPEHPLWKAHALVPPGSFALEGIEMGCKTVVVYSPMDMSCIWETQAPDSARGQLAFRLAGNIIAYATGMEPPKPRLTPTEVVRDDSEGKKIPRGYLKVVQLRHGGDWQPAPRAMRNLMSHLQDKTRLLVALKTEAVHPSQAGVLDFKFLYMHGRGSFDYAQDDKALANLRADLQTGGLLFADACCGKKAFDTSFREFIAKLFPDKKLERIPPNDDLFGKELNGEAITSVRCRREKDKDDTPEAEFREVQPYLEGIKLNNRWVVIYSKYDIGCALEKHQSTDCLGHDHDSAVRLGTAAVLYALKR